MDFSFLSKLMDSSPVSNFLQSVGNSLGGRAGGEAGDAVFGPSDRISDERFRENEARATISNENDVNRSNTFLSGVIGQQAKSYNQFANDTFSEDTRRENERILQQSEALGMSPWELKGATGATPLPSPGFTGGGASNRSSNAPAFMANQQAMATAALQAKTALATTKMQTDATKYASDNQLKATGITTNEGKLPKQQTVESAARSVLANAQSEQTWNKITLDQVQALLDAGTRERVDTPFYKSESNTAAPAVRQMLKSMDTSENKDMPITEALKKFNPDARDKIMGQVKKLAETAATGLEATTNAIGSTVNSFLSNQRKQK